ncbi:MAG: hypothetical protein U5R31_06805 [Acidimicrobiia bacterium]|nr:hypothetical protein [Acidimicrobiia bacterium]
MRVPAGRPRSRVGAAIIEDGDVDTDRRAGVRRWALRIGVVLVGAYVALAAVGWLFQDQLIYLESPPPPGAGEVLHGDEQEVRFRTADGLELAAYWMLAGAHVAPTDPAPAVLYLPGNAGNRADRLAEVRGPQRTGAVGAPAGVPRLRRQPRLAVGGGAHP